MDNLVTKSIVGSAQFIGALGILLLFLRGGALRSPQSPAAFRVVNDPEHSQ
jgi:hypothetical protein